MKVEDIFYREGSGYIAIVSMESEESYPKRGDKLILDNQEVMITDIETFFPWFGQKPITCGLLVRGYRPENDRNC